MRNYLKSPTIKKRDLVIEINKYLNHIYQNETLLKKYKELCVAYDVRSTPHGTIYKSVRTTSDSELLVKLVDVIIVTLLEDRQCK